MSSSNLPYAQRSARADVAAAKVHRAWMATLPLEERRKAIEMGVYDSYVEKAQCNDHESDVAGWTQLSVGPAPFQDSLADEICEQFGVTRAQAEALASWHTERVEAESTRGKSVQLGRIVGGLIKPGNLRVRAYSLALASNLGALNGIGTQTEAARACNTSRSNMSKETVAWSDLLELPPSIHQKSQSHRKALSESQKKNHWRKKKCSTNSKQKPSTSP